MVLVISECKNLKDVIGEAIGFSDQNSPKILQPYTYVLFSKLNSIPKLLKNVSLIVKKGHSSFCVNIIRTFVLTNVNIK